MKPNTNQPDFRNPIGLKVLYEQYSPRLFKFCLSFVKDEQAAKEVVQEVFVTIWEKRNSIEIKGNLEAYLVKLAKFKMIDNYRSTQRLEKLYATLEVNKTSEPTPEDHAVFENTKKQVLSTFKELPKKAQKIFFLSRKKGLTNKQIAQNLDVSEKTVEYHIKNSLKRFKASLLPHK